MKFTNTQKGPRGLNTKTGPVLVEPKETVDVEMDAAEAKIAKATGWFDVGEDDEPKGLADLTVNGLKTIAEAEAIDLGDATKKADIVAAIELAREEKAQA